jgi:hypothetical protein
MNEYLINLPGLWGVETALKVGGLIGRGEPIMDGLRHPLSAVAAATCG